MSTFDKNARKALGRILLFLLWIFACSSFNFIWPFDHEADVLFKYYINFQSSHPPTVLKVSNKTLYSTYSDLFTLLKLFDTNSHSGIITTKSYHYLCY